MVQQRRVNNQAKARHVVDFHRNRNGRTAGSITGGIATKRAIGLKGQVWRLAQKLKIVELRKPLLVNDRGPLRLQADADAGPA